MAASSEEIISAINNNKSRGEPRLLLYQTECLRLVCDEDVTVVNVAVVFDFDSERTGPARVESTNTVVCAVCVGSDKVAVFIIDEEVKVCVAVTVNDNDSFFTTTE